jgi:hypothetical protein
MNPTAIYSKSGKGVQEASGKTSQLARGDRAVLSAFDGKITAKEVAERVGKPFDAKFEQLVNQLDRDGYIRKVSAGAPPAGSQPPARPAGGGGGADLDFTASMPAVPRGAPPPTAPAGGDLAAKARFDAERRAREEQATSYKAREADAKAQAAAFAKAREEAEIKAQKERERIKAETEAKLRAETEAKMRSENEQKAKEAEAKAKAEAELQAKLEAERARAREEAERIRREAEEKARKEAEELKRRLEEERKAREEAERARKEAEEQAREEARRRKEEEERREHEAREREAREKAEREAAQREKAEAEAKAKAEAKAPAAGDGGSFSDSLLADLDTFTQRDEDDRKANDEAERKSQEEARRRAEEEAERQEKEAKEAAARRKHEDEERRRRDEEERRAQEEDERQTKEAIDRRRREDEERERKAREAIQKAAAAPGVPENDRDIGVSDADLGMEDVKRDEAALTKESRRAAREREIREKEARREAKRAARRSKGKENDKEKDGPVAEPMHRVYRRPRKWGKPLAITLLLLLAAAIGVLHVMPISTAEYEQAASEALGHPVRIASAKLSLVRGLQIKLRDVSVGDVKIANVAASPAIGSLFDAKKAFSSIDLEGVTLPQQALGALFSAKLKSANFSVERISARQLKLPGPVMLPTLQADVAFAIDGAVTSATLRGPDSLMGKLTPRGREMQIDVVANSLTVPIFPSISLNSFAMKGSATPEGMNIESWGGSTLDGGVSGTASVRWGENWDIDGVVTVRGINAAVFAPALLSEGKAEGTGKFSLHDADPMTFLSRGRLEGTFSVHKGVLGSFDLSRAITTGGRQAGGRTPFTGMSGQGVFDRGAVALRNVSFGAGALNAGASADITAGGALSGRIVADVRTSSQTLRAIVNLGGTVKDPQVKN